MSHLCHWGSKAATRDVQNHLQTCTDVPSFCFALMIDYTVPLAANSMSTPTRAKQSALDPVFVRADPSPVRSGRSSSVFPYRAQSHHLGGRWKSQGAPCIPTVFIPPELPLVCAATRVQEQMQIWRTCKGQCCIPGFVAPQVPVSRCATPPAV
jgi:hypothetical protein